MSPDEPLVECIAEEFLARHRRGEKPSIDEFCRQYLEHEGELRSFLPALLAVEKLKPDSEDESGTFGSHVRLEGRRLEQVGDYRILREIGRGGMGVVYEAEQQSLGRRVALKLLPRQMAGDGKAAERFGREARAAARMHHTNIVPVFDVGQDDAHLFYAMQLIQGQGLDLVIDDLKQLRTASAAAGAKSSVRSRKSLAAGAARSIAHSLMSGRFEQEQLGAAVASGAARVSAPALLEQAPAMLATETVAARSDSTASAVLPGQSDLSTAESNRQAYYRSVAQIGLQTASAFSYAHARGIIHRDIKPSNLLLDASGVVWVTDFGLAKTDDQAMTHTGDILGTIRYMAPERFRGQCDVRADIYALGLTLYELLALEPAFESADRLELIEMVSKTEPAAPRSIDPRIPRDLETIVLKSIDKDPKRRYQSADELAEDLERFIHDEPIRARRISTLERFARWSRRNKGLAASLAAVVALLLVIAGGSAAAAAYFQRQERQQRELALEKGALAERNARLAAAMKAERDEAERQRARAERSFAKARETVDTYLTKVSEDQLLQAEGMQPLREELLGAALEFYREFVAERADDPELRKALAASQLRVARILYVLSREGAGEAFRESRRMYQQLAADNPDDPEVLEGLARSYRHYSDYPNAIAILERLVRGSPEELGYRDELATAYSDQASYLARGKDDIAVLEAERRALELRAELVRCRPDDPEYRRAYAASLNNVAVRLSQHGYRAAAASMYRRAWEQAEAALEQNPHNMRIATFAALAASNLAGRQNTLGDVQGALDSFKRSTEISRQLALGNPEVKRVRNRMIERFHRLIRHRQRMGHYAEAREDALTAVETIQRLPDTESGDLLDLVDLVNTALQRSDPGELTDRDRQQREQLGQLAVITLREVARERLKEDPTRIPGRFWQLRFSNLAERDEFTALIAELERSEFDAGSTGEAPSAKPELAETPENIDADLATSLFAIGMAQVELGSFEPAERSLRDALEIRRRLASADPKSARRQADVALVRIGLGLQRWKSGRLSAAQQLWKDEFAVIDRLASELDPGDALANELGESHRLVSDAYKAEGLWSEAADHLQQTVAIDPTNHYRTFLLLPLLLQAGRAQQYREYRTAMLAQYGDTADPETAERTAKVCLLLPAEADELETALRLADRAVAAQEHQGIPWFRMAKGLAEYRRGDPEAAEEWFERNSPLFIRRLVGGGRSVAVPSAAVRAMIAQQRGETERAKTLLAGAESQLKASKEEDELLGHDQLICEILLREAHRKVYGAARRVDPQVHRFRGRAYYRLGRNDEAEAEFTAAVETDRDDPRLWLQRSRTFAEMDLAERAETDLQRAVALMPAAEATGQRPQLLRELARTYRALQRDKEAAATFQQAVREAQAQLKTTSDADHSIRRLRPLAREFAEQLRTLGRDDQAERVLDKLTDRLEARAAAPLLTLTGHTHNWVESVDVLPDGRRALSCAHDGVIRLWDLVLGEELAAFEGHEAPVRAVLALSDGRRFLSCGDDGTIRLWDLETREELRAPLLGHAGRVMDIALSADQTRLLSAGDDGTVRLWDLSTGRQLLSIDSGTGADDHVLFTPDGQRAVWTDTDHALRVWDLQANRELFRLSEHESEVWSLALSSDSRRALSGARNEVILWDLETGKSIRRITVSRAGRIRHCQFLEGGRALVACQGGERALARLLVIDLQSGTRVSDTHWPSTVGLFPIPVSPGLENGPLGFAIVAGTGRVVAAHIDGTVRLWSMPLIAPAGRALDIVAAQLQTLEADPVRREKIAVDSIERSEVFSALLGRRPNDPALLVARALTWIGERDWDRAAADFLRAIDADPGVADRYWQFVGPLLLETGHADSYRRLAREMLLAGDPDDRSRGDFIGTQVQWMHACLLLADAVDDWDSIDAFAERAGQRFEGAPNRQFLGFIRARRIEVQGMIAYRAGRYEQAVGLLESDNAAQFFNLPVTPRLFLSMAYARLDRLHEAQRAYDEAMEILARRRSRPERRWTNLRLIRMSQEFTLAAETVAREAKALLEEKKTDVRTATPETKVIPE